MIESSTPVTVTTRMVYDRRSKYLVRIEDDSRGFELLKMGRIGGDPGGLQVTGGAGVAVGLEKAPQGVAERVRQGDLLPCCVAREVHLSH